MTILGPDILSVFAGQRYPWIFQAVFAQGQDTALTCKLSLCGPPSHDGLVSEVPAWVRREHCCLFSSKLQSAPQSKSLSSVSLPQNCLPVFSAADWAVAVCTQMEGKAGGSPVVAKGSGNAKGMQGALTTALEFAQSKL